MCTEFEILHGYNIQEIFHSYPNLGVVVYNLLQLAPCSILVQEGLNLVVYVEVSQVFLELVPCHLHMIRDCRLLLEQIPLEHILHPKPSPAFITPCWQAKSIASCSLFHELEHLPKRSRNLTRVHRSMAMFFGPGKVQ